MKLKSFLIIGLLFFLVGCGDVQLHINNSYNPPTITKAPIEGKWTITKIIFTPENRLTNFDYKDYIGKDIIFSSKAVVVENTTIKSPEFKIKRINSDMFFENKFNTSKESIGVKSDYVFLVDVLEENSTYFQVLREKDDLAYLDINGIFVQIKKTSDQVTDKDIENLSHLAGNYNFPKVKTEENGFLLGFEIPAGSKRKSYQYRTYFFKIHGKDLVDIMQMEDLILPRDDGFYKISNNKVKVDQTSFDSIQFEKLSNKNQDPLISKIKSIEYPQFSRSILYLSPNYIGLENMKKGSKEKTLALYAINSIDREKSLSFGDLVENGNEIYEDTAKFFLPPNNTYEIDDRNFSIIRSQGFWVYRGRINFNVGEGNLYKDFPLKTTVGKDINKYNQLQIPLAKIEKNLGRPVKDAFFAPNNQLLLTLEDNHIRLYPIDEDQVIGEMIREIKIPSSSRPILAEWCLGQFVDNWNNELNKGDLR